MVHTIAQSTILAIVSAVILLTIFYVVYQVNFHPLAKYPGPLLAKLTGARAGYMAWTGDLHLDMWRCHQKYGPYVRYAPNYLLFNTAQAVKDIYGHNKNLEKCQAYLLMAHHAPSLFSLVDKREHAWKKRIISQKLSDTAIRSFEPDILSLIEKFCGTLRTERDDFGTVKTDSMSVGSWSKSFNMSDWSDYLFFDLTTTSIFGMSFDLIEKPDFRHIPKALEHSNQRVSVIVQFPSILFRRIDKKLFRQSIRGRKAFLSFVTDLVRTRMQQGHKNDVFSVLIDGSDPDTGKKLTLEEIISESITMLVAGSDTSATLLASMFFYLSRDEQRKSILVEEIRTSFEREEDITISSVLRTCRYLRASIQECLRMSPPAGAAPFRRAMEGGASVDEHFIPEGAVVGTGIYSMHHDEKHFKDAFRFVPERWLDGKCDGDAHNFSAFNPFSVGPRACPGRALALAEVSLVMAKICWTMDFCLDQELRCVGGGDTKASLGRNRPDEFQLYDHITSAKNGPFIRFKSRNIE